MFLPLMRARAGAVLLFIVAAISACTVVVEDDMRPIRPGPGPICTREYEPVCAQRGGDRQTFANACLADRSGYRVVNRGECRRGSGGGGAQFCTQQYAPVCASRGSVRQTFGNSCLAEQAGYRIVAEGECRRAPQDRFCTREYAPVCARRGDRIRTFPNACEAETSGYRIVGDGPC